MPRLETIIPCREKRCKRDGKENVINRKSEAAQAHRSCKTSAKFFVTGFT